MLHIGLVIIMLFGACAVGGALLLYRGIVSAWKKRWAGSLCRAIPGLFLLAVAVWIPACIWAIGKTTGQMFRCQENLGRKIYHARFAYANDHPGETIPPGWLGEGPEPMCNGSGSPLPYVYLPYTPKGESGAEDHQAWLAYCPHPHKRYWWVFWNPFGHVDRAVSFQDGSSHQYSEQEFQEQLKQRGRP